MNLSNEQAEQMAQLWSEVRAPFKPEEVARLDEFIGIATHQRPAVVPESPLQRPPFYFPGLTAKPWHDAADFAATKLLEAHWETILGELRSTLATRRGFQPNKEDGDYGGLWNMLYLQHGAWKDPDNRRSCPKTVEICETIPRLGEMVAFSALNPGGHIRPHCGPWNTRLTLHLGLVIPEGCTFTVGSEVREWQPGRCLVFDDSFTHEVRNTSESTRVVLIADFWHPELTDLEIRVLDLLRGIVWEQTGARDLLTSTKKLLDDTKWWYGSALAE